MGDTKIFMTAVTLLAHNLLTTSTIQQIKLFTAAGFNASFAVTINYIGLTTKHNSGTVMVSDSKTMVL